MLTFCRYLSKWPSFLSPKQRFINRGGYCLFIEQRNEHINLFEKWIKRSSIPIFKFIRKSSEIIFTYFRNLPKDSFINQYSWINKALLLAVWKNKRIDWSLLRFWLNHAKRACFAPREASTYYWTIATIRYKE